MTTETTVAPVAETQTTATEVVETPEVTTPEVGAEASEAVEVTTQEQSESEADKALKRMQRRIDKRTADVYRERAQNEQLARRVAELEAQSGTAERPLEQASPQALAREIARVDRYREQAEQIVNSGSKAYPDYMVALKELAREVGDFVKPNGAPSDFMDVVLEVVEKPAEVLYHLGKNPDLAEELANLSPLKLAKKLDRIERELTDKSKPKPSSAPKPLETVRSVSSGSKDPSKMTDREFADWRHSQIKARGNF